jgi:hypothetical protein
MKLIILNLIISNLLNRSSIRKTIKLLIKSLNLTLLYQNDNQTTKNYFSG